MHGRKVYAGVELQVPSFLTSPLLEMSGQLHAMTTLSLGQVTPVPHWIGGCVSPRADPSTLEKREISCLLGIDWHFHIYLTHSQLRYYYTFLTCISVSPHSPQSHPTEKKALVMAGTVLCLCGVCALEIVLQLVWHNCMQDQFLLWLPKLKKKKQFLKHNFFCVIMKHDQLNISIYQIQCVKILCCTYRLKLDILAVLECQ